MTFKLGIIKLGVIAFPVFGTLEPGSGIRAYSAHAASVAPPEVEVHSSPSEKLELIDLALIRSAKSSIDLAAFIISDAAIADALLDARGRGVTVRIVIDRHERAYDKLDGLEDVTRAKRGNELQHLKSFAIDGAVLRAGSANFSVSGEIYQSNDLIVIRDAAGVARYQRMFEALWSGAAETVE